MTDTTPPTDTLSARVRALREALRESQLWLEASIRNAHAVYEDSGLWRKASAALASTESLVAEIDALERGQHEAEGVDDEAIDSDFLAWIVTERERYRIMLHEYKGNAIAKAFNTIQLQMLNRFEDMAERAALWDRLECLEIDDALIEATERVIESETEGNATLDGWAADGHWDGILEAFLDAVKRRILNWPEGSKP